MDPIRAMMDKAHRQVAGASLDTLEYHYKWVAEWIIDRTVVGELAAEAAALRMALRDELHRRETEGRSGDPFAPSVERTGNVPSFDPSWAPVL